MALVAIAIVAAGSPYPVSVQGQQAVNASPNPAPKAALSFSDRFEKEGVRIDFSIKATSESGQGLVSGADAVVSFSLNDARSGQPLTGVRPTAWISSRKLERLPTEQECKEKIRTFVGGLLSARPDIDLNSYLLLTLNHDNTISIINPVVSFSRSKLENLITLPGPGADWVLSPNKQALYVTLPEQSAVAVINTITGRLVATVTVGENTRPMRIVLQPDGRRVWVGLDGSPSVAVIDTETNRLAATIKAGAGLQNIAFTPDGQFAYVTNSAADTVTAIDAGKLTRIADIAVGKTPSAVAYSPASRMVYVATKDGMVSVIDRSKQQVVRSIPVRRGTVALRFDRTGRYGFAVNQAENVVEVIDASTGEVKGAVEVVKSPDQVSFTDHYAYIRGTGSEKFSLVELAGIAKGKFASVDIIAGQKPPSVLPSEIGVADMIAPTPEGNAAMIANAPDGMIYYYMEGMMAPMGTFSNYKRHARALMVLDRSLAETAPGVYSVPIKLTGAGRFDVAVLMDQPRITHCFQLEVAPSPDAPEKGASVAVKASFEGKQFKSGEPVALRFKLMDSATGQPIKGLADVNVLVFQPPGIWQQRQWAKEVSEGEYEVMQTFPHAGQYTVMLRIQSRGVTFRDLPFIPVTVTDK